MSIFPSSMQQLHVYLGTPSPWCTHLLHDPYGFSISVWNALKSQKCLIYFTWNCIYSVSCHMLWVGMQKTIKRKEKRKRVKRQIIKLLNFSGHKFVWDPLWGLITHNWIIGGPEKRTLSTFFSYNLHTLTFFSAQLFLPLGLWVRPFDTAGFQESYQRYCEMTYNYMSVSGCDPKGILMKLNE